MSREIPLIVISDDEPAFTELYEAMLGSLDYRFAVVPDKGKLLDDLNTLKPDLIITEISSYGMDGLQLLKAMKASPALRDIPVVIVTLDGQYSSEARNMGASGFIVKPFGLNEFMDAVNGALSRSRRRKFAE